MERITNKIPNFITCLNVLCGSVAIMFAAGEDTLYGGMESYKLCWLFIGLAAVADFCDGFAARLLRAYSEKGKELDSLCDNVSFGVAPAALMFFALRSAGAPEWLTWVPMLIPVATALRLAKFNLDTRQSVSFLGLPVPANAIFWIGYSSLIYSGAYGVARPWLVVALVAAMCWLMLSEVPLMSLKFKNVSLKDNAGRLLLIFGFVVLVLLTGIQGLMWGIVWYVILSLAEGAFARRRR